MKEQYPNEIHYTPSKYSRNLNSYTKSQLSRVQPFFCAISKDCEYCQNFPVYKVLKAVAKLFMLNEMESIFLAYLIRETKWNIKQRIILMNADGVRDIICVAMEQIQYKCLILYLMVCSYTVKFYLNEEAEEALDEAHRVCPNFNTVFKHWAKKHNHLTSKISPRILNRIYKELYCSSRYQEADFNRMVDAIMHISPAYNPEREKNKEDQREQKKEVVSPHAEVKIENCEGVNPELMTIPLFSSSGFLHMANGPMGPGGVESGIYTDNGGNNSFINYMDKSRSKPRQSAMGMMNSSFGGIPHNFSINEEQQCQELMVGLEDDGHSQQNIYFENGNIISTTPNKNLGTSRLPGETGPSTCVITLNRGISFNDIDFGLSQSGIVKQPMEQKQ